MERRLKSIMLVEDCEADNFLHKKIIRSVGIAEEITVMRSGADALARLRENRADGLTQPELIFLDINTPGMEGWDFVEEFGKLDSSITEGTIIVMLSGSLNPDDRARAEAMPLIKEYLAKPLTRERVMAIAERYFS